MGLFEQLQERLARGESVTRTYITARDVQRKRIASAAVAREILADLERDFLIEGKEYRPVRGGKTARQYTLTPSDVFAKRWIESGRCRKAYLEAQGTSEHG
jgi:hypothetical protein